MPISELPSATVSAIGSTSALCESCSVIKELIDNALDAGATSISVEVSPNSLDTLQVKDNGSGIGPDDRELVCKPSHTSKIHSLDDLKNVGYRSLGFRGLALASIVELSGSVIITTKAAREALGTILQYDRTGQIVKHEKIAHPEGTTVRVSDFFKHVPVRRKANLKNSTRTLSDIKKLQQDYAMARPSIRFALKVQGGKGQNDWIYPAKPEASIMDAVLKIAGADIASQCMVKAANVRDSEAKYTSPQLDDDGHNADPGSVRVVAVLLKVDGDFSKASRCGQYVSVDGRPLSADRGIAKAFSKLYKSYINSVTRAEDKPNVVAPFLCLHLSLPPSSYDANVEPSKDDVLLGHESSVLSVVENLFKEAYGDNSGGYTDDPERRTRAAGTAINADDDGESTTIHGHPRGLTILRSGHVTRDTSQSILSPSPCQERISEKPSAVANPPQGQRRTNNANSERISKSRPTWMRAEKPTTGNDNSVPRDPSSQLLTPRREGNESPVRPAQVEHRGIDQPLTEHLNDSPLKPARWARKGPTRVSQSTDTQNSRGNNDLNNNGTLDGWVGRLTPLPTPSKTKDPAIPAAGADEGDLIAESDLDSRFRRSAEIDVDVHERHSRSLSHWQQLDSPTQYTGIGLKDDNQVLRPSPDDNSDRERITQVRSSLPPLEEALDFEQRKKQAAQCQRWATHSRAVLAALGSQTCGTTSPAKSRTDRTAADSGIQNYTTGIPVSRVASNTTSDLSTYLKLHDNNPRVYYMRHATPLCTDATGMAKRPLRRIPTDRLPLESISEKAAIHHLSTTAAYHDCIRLPSLVNGLSSFDAYTRSGDSSYHILRPLSSDVILDWKRKLLGAIQQHLSVQISDFSPTFTIDLHSVLERHRDLHGNKCDESMKSSSSAISS